MEDFVGLQQISSLYVLLFHDNDTSVYWIVVAPLFFNSGKFYDTKFGHSQFVHLILNDLN